MPRGYLVLMCKLLTTRQADADVQVNCAMARANRPLERMAGDTELCGASGRKRVAKRRHHGVILFEKAPLDEPTSSRLAARL